MSGRWKFADDTGGLDTEAAPAEVASPERLSRRGRTRSVLHEESHSAPLAMPGVLRSESTLIVQTRQAQQLILGRRFEKDAPGITGMMRFATLVRSIWGGARADDPFADWWLVRVHDAIEESERELLALKQHVALVLKRMPGITVNVAQSLEPLVVPLTFSNPYAFRGAYLLAQYDEVVRGILTARHVALADRDSAITLLGEAARHTRRAYLSALGYEFLGITRDDVRLMTARGIAAQSKMGAVPKDVLDGRLKAPHAPNPAREFAFRRGQLNQAQDPGDSDGLVTEPEPPVDDGAVIGVNA